LAYWVLHLPRLPDVLNKTKSKFSGPNLIKPVFGPQLGCRASNLCFFALRRCSCRSGASQGRYHGGRLHWNDLLKGTDRLTAYLTAYSGQSVARQDTPWHEPVRPPNT
jgi:hypothetical protein